MAKLEDKYNPSGFEDKIYRLWLEKNYFHGVISKSKRPYSIVIPPPNITGHLHTGHALNNTLQDIMIRFARMKGFSACWIPGTDHAGIATQNVVEKELNKNGTSRFELGREKFVEKVWEWRNTYGSRIISQLKALGCSCDWDRIRFTLDDDYVRAVHHEFVTLYRDGLIYRGNYMVNWCPRCLTAISDIEVEHREKKGSLWDIRYPLIDEKTGRPSSIEYITVSTTRPETMLGDTAVAVNPQDKRYKKYIGRRVFLPLIKREIPIILDSYVDTKFGTGAVKVTPAHDPNDFEIGERHKLEKINIMTDDAMMNENTGNYCGLERYRARKKVIEDLKKQGYITGVRDHSSSIGTCSRCDTAIEPRISNQWFVSMKKLAMPAIAAVKDGRVKFVPKKWEKIYFNWMENIRDWCISRQLWWGHRIPVWYCQDCDEMIVAELKPQKCKCGSKKLVQDSDVLDTWFSSCLWPFATLGWPEETDDLEYYFPTSVLITAHDIIFFWVARMIMMSLYFTKEVPFREVFINPLVNDIFGQKMSKSRGNVIDPLTIIEKSGTDALRLALAALTTPGKNLLLGEEKIEGSRNFVNKLWNASKFVISNLENTEIATDFESVNKKDLDLNLWDRWILSRFARAIRSVERYIEKYNMSFACRALISFFWNDYCDWYIESAKLRLNDKKNKDTAAFVLWYILERYLRLLHPFTPFVTEKIWQNIPHKGDSIIESEYPVLKDNRLLDKIDSDSEKNISLIFKIISQIRKIRSELKINPGVKIKASIQPADDNADAAIKENERYILSLAKLESLAFTEPQNSKGYIKSVIENNNIYIYLLDVIDIELEITRITSEISKLGVEVDKSLKKIKNPQFIKKAPKQIIGKEKARFEKVTADINILQEQLKLIKNLKQQ